MVNICVSGHRPNKIYGYDIYNKKYNQLRDKYLEVLGYISDKYNGIEYLFNGMAIGWDTITFEETYFAHDEISIIGCIPFYKQNNKWNKRDREIYEIMKGKSDGLVYVDTLEAYTIKGTVEGEYDIRKMQKRNEYMVNNSEIIITCWNGEKQGGTWQCIRYGLQSQWVKEIVNINPKTLEIEILK